MVTHNHLWVHTFWRKVVTFNPVNSQTGKRHFSCVSMATNKDLHRMFFAMNCLKKFSLFFRPADLFVFASEQKLEFFIYIIFCPVLPKPRPLPNAQWWVWGLLLLFLLFFINCFRACFLTYLVMVAVGFKQLCICHTWCWTWRLNLRNKETLTHTKKDTDR